MRLQRLPPQCQFPIFLSSVPSFLCCSQRRRENWQEYFPTHEHHNYFQYITVSENIDSCPFFIVPLFPSLIVAYVWSHGADVCLLTCVELLKSWSSTSALCLRGGKCHMFVFWRRACSCWRISFWFFWTRQNAAFLWPPPFISATDWKKDLFFFFLLKLKMRAVKYTFEVFAFRILTDVRTKLGETCTVLTFGAFSAAGLSKCTAIARSGWAKTFCVVEGQKFFDRVHSGQSRKNTKRWMDG